MIVNNLKFLRQSKNFTQAEMLDFIGIKGNTKWSDYERGKSNPPLEILLLISDKFKISLDDLTKKDLSNTKISQKIEVAEKQDNTKKNTKIYTKILPQNVINEPVVVYGENAPHERFNVFDLDSKAAAGMAVLLQDKDKFNNLPSLHMPYLGAGLHIRLKITGDSMHNTIKDGDKVVATHCPEPASALREGNIYVIFDKEEGIVCKRIYKVDKHNLDFVSDNDVYKPYKRHLNDIQAIFRVVEVHTTDLRNYNSDTRKEITLLWKEVQEIKQKLKP